MTESGGVHNENSGKVSGISFQARDVHGNVTLQHRAAGADELLAGYLADAVRELSRKEEDHWRIGDPAPLSVRWHSAEQDLFDYWENIQASPQRADPVSLSGEFTTIRETFKATGSQRLLVLGRAGAGKTVLAHRLVLDLIEHRDHRAPVPVLFSLSDWNPITTGLRDWMANRLVRDHPFLAKHDVTGKRSAELLVDRDWVLPVLDGFDELPEQHRRAAISEISRVRWPLMVTSRPAEYAQAAREVKAVGRAAAIELEDLTLEQTEQYLRRSSNPSRATEWECIFEYLRTEPATIASRNLAPVVTTPLMVMLARTTYNDVNENSPGNCLIPHASLPVMIWNSICWVAMWTPSTPTTTPYHPDPQS
ncbi:NACHT domain-containing NTPase [Saccharopolyspora gloriosae]|uniref:NACHT domain-containing protein n=1 Tax=Saccharopolyspora gloriosae TaxID=455344 RepID=UPI001FB84FE4|nr:NACHT domain-containing protein [Saccharopolyspora gloriosae]